ncbi:hypothetical protein L798_12928 [Zootermopsis nevadensis]|uniref:Uncharacterized protein n=1 Tax=Zootermopsis nevadensis TaxID=136037 RepID=A0A067QVJ9_ZOONE|nr:hypothetical protein L798_12928 [Zootermopsis nevadensis]
MAASCMGPPQSPIDPVHNTGIRLATFRYRACAITAQETSPLQSSCEAGDTTQAPDVHICVLCYIRWEIRGPHVNSIGAAPSRPPTIRHTPSPYYPWNTMRPAV